MQGGRLVAYWRTWTTQLLNQCMTLQSKVLCFLPRQLHHILQKVRLLANSSSVSTYALAGGCIFFFSSVATKKSTLLPNYLLLVSSRGAIEQICWALASDLGERGITVNTISPGPIDSEGYRAGKSEHMLQFIWNLHMQKRIGMPSEIAEAIGFLATKDGRWINGQNIPINGVK